jgi:acetyltransferase-like isoleucine patch superfamily enzyme
MIKCLVQDFIRNISGSLGIRIRRLYYINRFKKCGKNLVIGEGVFFDNPKNIIVGDNVWIDKYCIFITGKINKHNCRRFKEPTNEGQICIGNNAHIGIRSVFQAHGGISIGDYFTSGTDVKLYTLSNDVNYSMKGTHSNNQTDLSYILTPITIGTNVWLGMQSIVIGGEIGDNVFLKANSISTQTIQSNSIAAGNPAVHIRNRFN